MRACKQEGEKERTKKRKKKEEGDESKERKGKLKKDKKYCFDVPQMCKPSLHVFTCPTESSFDLPHMCEPALGNAVLICPMCVNLAHMR